MQSRIRDIVSSHGKISIEPADLTASGDLYELGLTSHASVNVMLALEDEFDIEFPDEDLKKSTFASIGNIEAVVSRLLGELT